MFTFRSDFLLLIILLLWSGVSVKAQINESDLKSDSLMQIGYRTLGRAGFDTTASNGFYIRDQRKPQFSLNLGVWTTPRYNYIVKNNTPDSVESIIRESNVNRTRIYFTGKYSDRFNFSLVTNIGPDGNFTLQQVFLTWAVSDKYIVSIGRQFVASSREDWMDPSNIMAMQCSANDAVFALGTSFGLLLYKRPSNQQRWWVSLSNGLYAWNREISDNSDSDYMLGGRYEYALVGNDWTIYDDIVGRRGRSRGVLLGVNASFLSQSQALVTNWANQVNLDLTLNGDGYQVLFAGVWTGQYPGNSPSFNNYGLYMQGGYFITRQLQLYARYDMVHPGDQPGDLEVYSAPGFGVNLYPFLFTNRWKFSVEYNRLFSIMNKTIVPSDLALGFIESDYFGQHSIRLQIQFGF